MASIRSFGVERIGALSDGVVAIAITLLVLEIKIPEDATSQAMLWSQLESQLPEVAAWLISFVIIALVWYEQHYLFAHSGSTDSGFIVINMLQLGAVSLIPLGAHLVGRYAEDPLSAAIFSAIMLLNGMLMALNAWYLSQHTELHARYEARFLRRRAVYHAVSFPVAAIAALLLAVLHHPLVGTAVWVLKPFGYAMQHAVHNRYLDHITAQKMPAEGGTWHTSRSRAMD